MRKNIVSIIHFDNKFNDKFKIIIMRDTNPDNQLNNNKTVYEFELFYEQDDIEKDNWIEANFGYNNIEDIILDCKESSNNLPINKLYYVQNNIGRSKYVLSFHNGIKKHNDGSNFYDIEIFKNKKKLNNKITELKKCGYTERSIFYQ